MKKLQILKAARIAHIAVWTVIALLVIVSTCKVWWANGCGVSSLIAAMAFYGAACAALCLAGNTMFYEKIDEIESELNATPQKPQQPAAPAQQPRQRKQVF